MQLLSPAKGLAPLVKGSLVAPHPGCIQNAGLEYRYRYGFRSSGLKILGMSVASRFDPSSNSSAWAQGEPRASVHPAIGEAFAPAFGIGDQYKLK